LRPPARLPHEPTHEVTDKQPYFAEANGKPGHDARPDGHLSKGARVWVVARARPAVRFNRRGKAGHDRIFRPASLTLNRRPPSDHSRGLASHRTRQSRKGMSVAHAFDVGYAAEPFLTLCATYPDESVYPSGQFRVEWGPIFHRGRLDGSARVLVIGQDPAQHETVIRRILVGEAGRRLQGFLAKLGITRSYVCINAYLYSVFGSVKAATARSAPLLEYRERWLSALLIGQRVELVVALGKAASSAWNAWKATPDGQSVHLPFVAITHPTQPESSSKKDKAKLAAATKKMLQNWNAALALADGSIAHPDEPVPLIPYGDAWGPNDRPRIPDIDFPAGIPPWMRENDGWARRSGVDALAKRRNITITVSAGVVR
jgi:uracil-DNA glycosylase